MKLSRLMVTLALALAPAAAFGQGVVVQSGAVVPGNFAAWLTNGSVKDSGVSSISLNFPTLNTGHLLGNCTVAPIAAEDTSLNCLIDSLGSAAQGDVLYRSSAGWVLLAPGTSGQFLQTLGAAANPIWATPGNTTYTAGSGLTLTGTVFSVTAPVAVSLGGTGLTTGNSGGIPFFSGSTSMGSSAALTQHGLVLGGGAGVAPYPLGSLGTSGQVLTSNGASADPSWTAAATGTVSSVATGHALTGGPVTTTGTIAAVDAASGVAGVVTPDANAAHFLNGAGAWTTPAGTTPAPIVGTTGSIGGGSLTTDTCTSGTATTTGVTSAMAIIATPVTYPGDGITWSAYMSAANTTTVKVCNLTAGSVTPAAGNYNVRVLP